MKRLILPAVLFTLIALAWATPTRHSPFVGSQLDGNNWERVTISDSLVGTTWAVLEANGEWNRFMAGDTTVLVFHDTISGGGVSNIIFLVEGTSRYDSSRVASFDTVVAGVTEAVKFHIVKNAVRVRDSVFATVERTWVQVPDSGTISVSDGGDSSTIDLIPALKHNAGAAVVEAGKSTRIHFDKVVVGSHDPAIADTVEFEVRLFPNQRDSTIYESKGRATVRASVYPGPIEIPLRFSIEQGGRLEVWRKGGTANSYAWATIFFRRE